MSKPAFAVEINNRFAELLSDSDSETVTPAIPARNANVSSHEKRAPNKPESTRKPRDHNATNTATKRDTRVVEQNRNLEEVDSPVVDSSRPGKGRTGGKTRVPEPRRAGARQYDRRSGTGRGTEMKKSGGGGHNWGNEEADFGGRDAGKLDSDNAADGNTTPSGRIVGDGESPVAEVTERSIDFAEYQRQMDLKRQNLNQGNSGSPVRFVDSSELEKEGYEKYNRIGETDGRASRQYRPDEEVEVHSQRSKTRHLSVFTAAPPARGRGRGARNNGEPIRVPVTPVSVDLTDASAFPVLG